VVHQVGKALGMEHSQPRADFPEKPIGAGDQVREKKRGRENKWLYHWTGSFIAGKKSARGPNSTQGGKKKKFVIDRRGRKIGKADSQFLGVSAEYKRANKGGRKDGALAEKKMFHSD